MKKIFAVLALVAVLTLCLCACSGGDDVDGIFRGFEAVTLDGEKVTDEVYEGKKLTMINVWGTFCSPCIKEMPDLNTLNEKYADKGFQIIGIVCDIPVTAEGEPNEPKLKEAKGIIEDTGVKYLNILPYEKLNQTVLAGSYSIPMTYFVDETGEIIGESYVGSKSLEDWENIILSLLGE